MNSYKTVRASASAELIEKRSRFIGYIKPVSTEQQALDFINEKRKIHWDATHNVYAYIIRDEGIVRYSDDNEPQGTAGMPVLDVMRKRGITDCVIVVTRYFGGTLLGAGGLVRAYSASAAMAVESSGERVMTMCCVCSLRCPYTLYGKLPALIAKYAGDVDDSVFADDIALSFHIPEDGLSGFEKELSELSLGKCAAEIIKKDFFETK